MDARLQEVIDKGSPAQAALARRILADGSPPEQIAALFDAYLHDPYLTRSSS